MTRVNPRDPRAPYVQIADDLRLLIREGTLAVGERLSSTRDLARSYGVAPGTVQQAIKVLRDQGILESWQGRGVFVRDPDAEREGPDDRLGEVQAQIEELRVGIDKLATADDLSAVREGLAEIRRRQGILETRLIELYGRLGQPYPHDADGAQERPQRRRPTGRTA